MTLDRRSFLEASSAALLFGLAPASIGGLSRRPAGKAKTFVYVFLRGGIDGLNFVVPYGEASYYALRSSIAIARPGAADGALDLDGFFGLHPAAAPLLPLFRSGAAVAVHAVGHEGNTRSHFVEQDLWETAVAGNVPSTAGWMNRHLATSEGRAQVRAIAMGSTLPHALRGDASAIAVRSLGDLVTGDTADSLSRYEAELRAAHRVEDGESAAQAELAKSGRDALVALRELARVAALEPAGSVEYPRGILGERMSDAARLVRAGIGVELVAIDAEGWDTHDTQGGARGPFANRLAELSGSLAAFCEDLGDALDDVLVLLVSEFGRTAAENGTGGTDHGWGNCALALGGPVRKKSDGRARMLLGHWPGLAHEQLHEERDLVHTTDFRDLYAEVLRGHLGNPHVELVLPGYETRELGLI